MYTAVNIILDTRLKTEQILKFHIEKIESNFSVISGNFFIFYLSAEYYDSRADSVSLEELQRQAVCKKCLSESHPLLCGWLSASHPYQNEWACMRQSPFEGFKMCQSASHPSQSKWACPPPTSAACLNVSACLPPLPPVSTCLSAFHPCPNIAPRPILGQL